MTGKTKTGVAIDPQAPVTLTPAERTEQTTAVDTLMEQGDELARLQAEQRRVNAAIREAKGLPPVKAAAKPASKASLADVITKQRELPGRWVVLGLLSQATERAAADQPLEEALAQVAERYQEVVLEVVVNRAAGESLQVATWRHLAATYPRTNARTGPGSTKAAAE